MKIGQCVLVENDPKNIVYEIKSITGTTAYIVGINYRICKNIELDKLEVATLGRIEAEKSESEKYYNHVINQMIRRKKNYILGTVLHIDGDEKYLSKCLDLYSSVGIFAYGVKILESEMEKGVEVILKQVTPSIIVITGHDSFNSKELSKIDNYKNTEHFMKAVKRIRKTNTTCCIIAGACQSNFEALMASGANYASSPKRINIHTYDPAVIAIKVATTSFTKIVDFEDVLKFVENGRDAFGGVETFGKLKLLY